MGSGPKAPHWDWLRLASSPRTSQEQYLSLGFGRHLRTGTEIRLFICLPQLSAGADLPGEGLPSNGTNWKQRKTFKYFVIKRVLTMEELLEKPRETDLSLL